MALQARQAGTLLRLADVGHDVITRDSQLARIQVGKDTRSGRQRRASSPLLRVKVPRPARVPGETAAALGVFTLAAAAAMARSRQLPAPLKGTVLAVLGIAFVSAAYSAWWSPLPPLDVAHVMVDWRTSALVPMVALSLLYAYDLYPLPGNFALKTAWLALALGVTAVFSTVRLALLAAGYARYGAVSLLALHQVAGTFWDLLPGLALLSAAHASVAWSGRFSILGRGRAT
ncbi:MAG TPA: hypothetical protein VNE62_07665 [Actinomycetota bacterium]|nr:hypothetical protein [Actinomycetota bacterium]